MNAFVPSLGAGLACASPLCLLLAFRYRRLRRSLDAQARNRYLGRAGGLAASEVVAASLIASAGGRLALPAHWALALAVAAVFLLQRSLRGEGPRRAARSRNVSRNPG